MSASLMSCVRQNSPPLDSPPPTLHAAVDERHQIATASASSPPFADGGGSSSTRSPTSPATSQQTSPSSPNTASYASSTSMAAATASDDVSLSSLHTAATSANTNTQKRRRRFQPLRQLRRMFRLGTGAAAADATSVTSGTSSVAVEQQQRRSAEQQSGDFADAEEYGSAHLSPQRPPRESRSGGQNRMAYQSQQQQQHHHHQQHHGKQPAVLHLRDSRESVHMRESYDHQPQYPPQYPPYSTHQQHLQQHHQQHHHNHHQHLQHEQHQPRHRGGAGAHRQASDAVDFQHTSSAAATAAKRRSNSECLGGACKADALSQSHDSVFSESVTTASSMSSGLKAELNSVLMRKYQPQRTTQAPQPTSEAEVERRRQSSADDDQADDDEEEDLGLPRSPNTPARGGGGSGPRIIGHSLSSQASSRAAIASPQHRMHISSDGSLSMLSMDSGDLVGDGGSGSVGSSSDIKLRLTNRYQSETDADIGLPVTVLNHAAARHKMAVRPKRKQAPTRRVRPIAEDEDAIDAVETATTTADRTSLRSKSASLPPGISAKQLPQMASAAAVTPRSAGAKVSAVAADNGGDSAPNPRELYKNRSLSKSFDFDATPTAASANGPTDKDAGQGKEPTGFFRRLLTYGSLKKKPAAGGSKPLLNTLISPTTANANLKSAAAIVGSSPPEILPKPQIRADKPRSGPAARQRVQPRELAAMPAIVAASVPAQQQPSETQRTASMSSLTTTHKNQPKNHSSSTEKLPPISPTTKKSAAPFPSVQAASDRSSADSSAHAPTRSTTLPAISTEHLPPVATVQKSESVHQTGGATKRTSAELPSRTFELSKPTPASVTPPVAAFPLYRSDDQLYPRSSSKHSATTFAPLPAQRFSSTSCIMRPPASHAAQFAPHRSSNSTSNGTASPASVFASPASSKPSPKSSSSSSSRPSVEKSKSFRFYTEASRSGPGSAGPGSMHSSAGHMPSLPDLSGWSAASAAAASSGSQASVTTSPLDDSPLRSTTSSTASTTTSHSPSVRRELINKFEINDNTLVATSTGGSAVERRTAPMRSMSTGDATGTTTTTPMSSLGHVGPSGNRNTTTVVVTSTKPIVALPAASVSKGSATSVAVDPAAVHIVAPSTPTSNQITQIEDNIDRIMKFACVTVVKSGQPPASQLDAQRRFSNESVEITDKAPTTTAMMPPPSVSMPPPSLPPIGGNKLVERRQSVTDERLRFERRISQCENAAVVASTPSPSSESPTVDPMTKTTVTTAAPVVLRKKSVSYNARPQTTVPTSAATVAAMASAADKPPTSGDNDQTPELMKVFARRSLKLKDTFYVTDEPISLLPSLSLGVVGCVDASSADAADANEAANVINNNLRNSIANASADTAENGGGSSSKPITAPRKSVIPVAAASTADKKSPFSTATVAAATVATAWLSNANNVNVAKVPSTAVAAKPAATRVSAVPPKPALFNNNVLISNNNINTTAMAAAVRQTEDKANANVASGTIISEGQEQQQRTSADEVKMRKPSSGDAVGTRATADEFKGILQRKAEWEKRATQQFK